MFKKSAHQSEGFNGATPLVEAKRACYPALIAVFALSLFINIAMLTLPLFSMQLYDRVLSSGNLNTLIFLALIAAFFLVLSGILDYARAGILVRAGHIFDERLRGPLFNTLFHSSTQSSPAHAQQYLREAQAMRDTISSGAVSTLFDLPWTPFFVVLCFALHPVLGTVSVVGVIVLFLLAVVNELATGKMYAATAEHGARANNFIGSVFASRDAARGLGMGETLAARWSRISDDAAHSGTLAGERGAAVQAVTKTSRFMVQMAILAFGAWLAVEREISPGVMLASSIIMGRALAPVEQIVAQWKRIFGFRSSDKRLATLFVENMILERRTDLPAPTGHLAVEQVMVSVKPGMQPTVIGVDFELPAGQSLAIVGASGSGKSTLARALVGANYTVSGDIRLDGAALTQWNSDALGKHIGYVPQDVELIEGTVAENIARFTDAAPEDIIKAAKEACVHDVILRLPDGYETRIGHGGLGLSGGMRQRVALARALFGGPAMVVLDEPNSNLDEEGERALVKSVQFMKQEKRTVVLVTHRPQILAHVDNLLVMGLGRQIAYGPRDEVIANMRGNKVAAV